MSVDVAICPLMLQYVRWCYSMSVGVAIYPLMLLYVTPPAERNFRIKEEG